MSTLVFAVKFEIIDLGNYLLRNEFKVPFADPITVHTQVLEQKSVL